MAEKGRVFTGARARFSIDGTRVGYATSVNVAEEVVYEDVEVLDNIEVEEIVAVGYRVTTFTARKFRLIGETVKSLGWFPKNGANVAEHLSNIITQGDMTATIEDTKTGENMAVIQGVKMSSRNWTVDARGLVGEDVTFRAIRVLDESEG